MAWLPRLNACGELSPKFQVALEYPLEDVLALGSNVTALPGGVVVDGAAKAAATVALDGCIRQPASPLLHSLWR
jgi:hypothetical protein